MVKRQRVDDDEWYTRESGAGAFKPAQGGGSLVPPSPRRLRQQPAQQQLQGRGFAAPAPPSSCYPRPPPLPATASRAAAARSSDPVIYLPGQAGVSTAAPGLLDSYIISPLAPTSFGPGYFGPSSSSSSAAANTATSAPPALAQHRQRTTKPAAAAAAAADSGDVRYKTFPQPDQPAYDVRHPGAGASTTGGGITASRAFTKNHHRLNTNLHHHSHVYKKAMPSPRTAAMSDHRSPYYATTASTGTSSPAAAAAAPAWSNDKWNDILKYAASPIGVVKTSYLSQGSRSGAGGRPRYDSVGSQSYSSAGSTAVGGSGTTAAGSGSAAYAGAAGYRPSSSDSSGFYGAAPGVYGESASGRARGSQGYYTATKAPSSSSSSSSSPMAASAYTASYGAAGAGMGPPQPATSYYTGTSAATSTMGPAYVSSSMPPPSSYTYGRGGYGGSSGYP